MFLSGLFKHARTKALVALAGLTMVFGTAATISTVAATQQNEVVETKAASAGTQYYLKGNFNNWGTSLPMSQVSSSSTGIVAQYLGLSLSAGNVFGIADASTSFWFGYSNYTTRNSTDFEAAIKNLWCPAENSWLDYDGGQLKSDTMIYYHDTNGWGDSSRAYTYSSETLGGWPGQKMTKVADSVTKEGHTANVYGIDMNGSPAYVVFHDGSGHQTEDLGTPQSNNYTTNNIAAKRAGTYNVYLTSNDKIIIYNVNDIISEGLLAVSATDAAVKLWAWNGGDNAFSTSSWPGVTLSDVPGAITSGSTLHFNSDDIVYMVPIYCLRGELSSAPTTFVLSDGEGQTGNITLDSGAKGSGKISYVKMFDSRGGGAWSLSAATDTAAAKAARAAFDINQAVMLTTKSTVCRISESVADTLVTEYTAATNAGSTLHQTAEIYTWDGSKVNLKNVDTASTSLKKWQAISSSVYTQIESISTTGKPLTTITINGFYSGDNQSPLTLTLWIVLGAGVLGLGAIGVTYFVSKKKKRPQA